MHVRARPISPHLPGHLALPRPELEAECRRQCQSAYLGGRTLLCRVLGKYLVYADARDLGIVPHLCLDGYWEAWITQAVAAAVRPGWCCVDVGANHGYYTLLCADAVGPGGRVVACEPNPSVAALLEKTLRLNGFTGRTTLVREAVADMDGDSLALVVPPGRGMNAYLRPADPDGVPVRTVTLDTLCHGLGRVDLVKIDVEGAEEKVWLGMGETLRRHPEVTVLMEFNSDRYASPRGFLADIQARGFPLCHVDYDAQVKPVTAERLLAERPNEDWMLWLRRGRSGFPA
jgi:FkbM family methyltransferase